MNYSKLQKTTITSSLKQRAAILKKVNSLIAKREEISQMYDAEINTHVEIIASLDNTILKSASHTGTVQEVIDSLEQEKNKNIEPLIAGQQSIPFTEDGDLLFTEKSEEVNAPAISQNEIDIEQTPIEVVHVDSIEEPSTNAEPTPIEEEEIDSF